MSRRHGFTLFECMLCLALLSLIFCLGIPLNGIFFNKQHLDGFAEELKLTILYARFQAHTLGEAVILAPLKNKNWHQGAVLLKYNASHKVQKKDVLRRWNWNYPTIHCHFKGFHSQDYLIFSPDLKHAASNATFYLDGIEGKKCLVLNRFGRIKIQEKCM